MILVIEVHDPCNLALGWGWLALVLNPGIFTVNPSKFTSCLMDLCDQLLIGQSQAILTVRRLIRQVANSDLNVIIHGETGVGKELVAQALHLVSERKDKPLVKVNCAAIPGELLESELFGYEKGAFTGADARKIGKFELAHRGTILLDEIGDMPLFLQAKMLQVLQDFHFSRLGGKTDIKVDCWVLAATNQDLEQRIKEGLFREDLYYRMNIIRIFVPPLRERPEDIEPLTDYFTEQYFERTGKPPFRFNYGRELDFLKEYSWPGNVRELKNTIERLMILRDWQTVKKELLTRDSGEVKGFEAAVHQVAVGNMEVSSKKTFPSLKEVKKKAIKEAEEKLIRSVLAETGWNRKRAAKLLQISYKALLYKIKDHKIDAKN
jgi:two-component system response regulator AtoC